MTKTKGTIRKQMTFSEENFDFQFDKFLEMSEYAGSAYILRDILKNEIEDKQLVNLFQKNLGEFIGGFSLYFKDSELEKITNRSHLIAIFNAFWPHGTFKFNSILQKCKYFHSSVQYAHLGERKFYRLLTESKNKYNQQCECLKKAFEYQIIDETKYNEAYIEFTDKYYADIQWMERQRNSYIAYLKFLSQAVTAIYRNKRRDYGVDGYQKKSKHSREENLARKRD